MKYLYPLTILVFVHDLSGAHSNSRDEAKCECAVMGRKRCGTTEMLTIFLFLVNEAGAVMSQGMKT